MAKEQVLIVGTVRDGVLVPHIACQDMLSDFEGQQIVISVEQDENKGISKKMRASLHVYLRKLAAALSSAGYDQRHIMANIGKGAPIPPSETSLKALWKSVIDARRGKPSTEMSTNGEMCEDYKIFDAMMSEACKGVSVPWPSLESQSHESYRD